MKLVSPKRPMRAGITTLMLLFCLGVASAGEVETQQVLTEVAEPGSGPIVDPAADHPPVIPLADAVTVAGGLGETMTLLNAEIEPGTYRRLSWFATELFEGVPVDSPVLVVNGKLAGPTLCLTAAVHGSVDRDQLPLGVDQRPPGVAGVDRRVGLQHVTNGDASKSWHLSANGGDHADR